MECGESQVMKVNLLSLVNGHASIVDERVFCVVQLRRASSPRIIGNL